MKSYTFCCCKFTIGDFPKHMNLEWKEFVTKPWTMERGLFDKKEGFENRTDRFCQYHFKYNEVTPCKFMHRGDNFSGDCVGN